MGGERESLSSPYHSLHSDTNAHNSSHRNVRLLRLHRQLGVDDVASTASEGDRAAAVAAAAGRSGGGGSQATPRGGVSVARQQVGVGQAREAASEGGRSLM